MALGRFFCAPTTSPSIALRTSACGWAAPHADWDVILEARTPKQFAQPRSCKRMSQSAAKSSAVQASSIRYCDADNPDGGAQESMLTLDRTAFNRLLA